MREHLSRNICEGFYVVFDGTFVERFYTNPFRWPLVYVRNKLRVPRPRMHLFPYPDEFASFCSRHCRICRAHSFNRCMPRGCLVFSSFSPIHLSTFNFSFVYFISRLSNTFLAHNWRHRNHHVLDFETSFNLLFMYLLHAELFSYCLQRLALWSHGQSRRQTNGKGM